MLQVIKVYIYTHIIVAYTKVILKPSRFLLVDEENSLGQLEHEQNLHGDLFRPVVKLPNLKIPIEMTGFCIQISASSSTLNW